MEKLQTELVGFTNFVREQGVIGLAVGLAIGLAATRTVQEIVNGLISLLVGFLLGGSDLVNLTWNTGISRGGEQLVFVGGAVMNSFIVLLATAFVIYYIVHRLGLDKLDKKKD